MDERINYCIDAELRFARAKFPGSHLNFAALVEELGELSKALLDHSYGKTDAESVFAEAIQVAVMAIRVAQEGSSEFPYTFEHSHYQKFDVNKQVDSNSTAPENVPDKSKKSVAVSNQISGAFLRRFSGADCQCGKQKLENFPLCGVCFKKLPGALRSDLRQKKGGDLEAAYNEAVESLKNRSNSTCFMPACGLDGKFCPDCAQNRMQK